MQVGIIGSGVAGMAIAIRRAVRGDAVTVFEKNAQPGGKMGTLSLDGYRFDTGPSLFTLPELVAELFTLAGRNMDRYLRAEPLEIGCRYFFPDGSVFDFYRDRDLLDREIATKSREHPETVFRRLDHARQQYALGAPVFLFSDFHDWRNFNTPPFRHVAKHLGRLDFLRTMHRANRSDFRDDRFVRIFDRYATYNGSSPFRAPATLNMIAHLENNLGAYFPHGGIRAIADALYRLAADLGVTFRFNEQVRRIAVAGNRAQSLVTEQGTYDFDCIVSAVDARYAAENLWPRNPYRGRLKRSELSSSALIFYWGIDGQNEKLGLHNILFSDDSRQEFRDLFRRKTVPADPTVYIFISARAEPQDAPAGCENWFVMVNAPADTGQGWEALTQRTRASVIKRIDRMLGTDIASRIVREHITAPPALAQATNSTAGALYGTSSNSPLAAFLRHPNQAGRIGNLFFAGGSVHPGGGIPLCLASAAIVDRKITHNLQDGTHKH